MGRIKLICKMVDAGKRAEIQASQRALAEKILAGSGKMPVMSETEAHKVQLEWQDDCPVLVNSLEVDGVMVEDFKAYCHDYMERIKKIAPSNATYTALPKDGEFTCVHQRITPGVPLVSARVLCSTYYHHTDGDDYIFMMSSVGNEHLYDMDEVKKAGDVIATLDVNYMHFSPMRDSCDDICGTVCKQVVKTNPNGSLMDVLKKKLTQYQSKTLVNVAKDIKKNYK